VIWSVAPRLKNYFTETPRSNVCACAKNIRSTASNDFRPSVSRVWISKVSFGEKTFITFFSKCKQNGKSGNIGWQVNSTKSLCRKTQAWIFSQCLIFWLQKTILTVYKCECDACTDVGPRCFSQIFFNYDVILLTIATKASELTKTH